MLEGINKRLKDKVIRWRLCEYVKEIRRDWNEICKEVGWEGRDLSKRRA